MIRSHALIKIQWWEKEVVDDVMYKFLSSLKFLSWHLLMKSRPWRKSSYPPSRNLNREGCSQSSKSRDFIDIALVHRRPKFKLQNVEKCKLHDIAARLAECSSSVVCSSVFLISSSGGGRILVHVLISFPLATIPRKMSAFVLLYYFFFNFKYD